MRMEKVYWDVFQKLNFIKAAEQCTYMDKTKPSGVNV